MASPSPKAPDAAGVRATPQAIPIPRVDEPRERYAGPAILRQGFRPFFLAAALWAVAAVVLWLPILLGWIALPSAFDPLAWHAHEMIFGFAGAAVAGFLLTAIPNWTGRLPLSGLPLLGLASVWVAGRLAVAASMEIGIVPAALIDLAFLVLLFGFVLREILAGRNWRNLPVTVALLGLIAANALMHAEAIGWLDASSIGSRLGIAIIAMLISLIGGRIIPSFTRNWLVKRGDGALPVPFGRFDGLCLVVVLLAAAAWTVRPETMLAARLLLLAGTASLIRLMRWQGNRTAAEPLLWSLHLGFLWLPAGLLLLGASGFVASLPLSAGLHALTAGAAGSMILAVMTRATLGHTGRELHADGATAAIYLLAFAAAALRVAAAFVPAAFLALLVASAAAWIGAFLLFAVRYGSMLFGRGGT
jgi:uncharacterized protein involved in response to NO